MLYGTLEQQNDILGQAQEYADELGVKLIFGAVVGSISKGLHYSDSDYDARFLYLRQDFPQKICIPSEMPEAELVKRYYHKDKIYECIPLWETTSFLHFLMNPRLDEDISVGLYNIVGWTFQSPYVWDPYGLKSKIMPLINRIFNKEYEIACHKMIIEKYWKELEQDAVISKSYLNSLHAAATIEWSIKYNTQPPIDLQTLLYGLDRENIWKEAQIILSAARKMARRSIDDAKNNSHSIITTCYNSTIRDYVKEIRKTECIIDKCGQKENSKLIVNNLYDIIYSSVFENEKLMYRS